MPISFKNDYGQLAHPRILEALAKANSETHIPYGLDKHSEQAASYIKETFGAPNAKVVFLAGGTQTNMVTIATALRPHEAVIAVASGHINVHETGAVEASGHKILPAQGQDGKILPEEIAAIVKAHSDEHMVRPRMVYISDSTEIGTIYSKEELLALRRVCDDFGLLLFIDGARLGSALTCDANDVEPRLLGQVADAFYVGGTKNGLLIGEALVLVNPTLQKDIRYIIKNKGAMLAKGYLLGIEFEEAFRGGFYFELARQTNVLAAKLRNGLASLGLSLGSSPTNQIFVTLPKPIALSLIDEFGCEKWEDKGGEMTIRFVVSFACEEEDIDFALDRIATFLGKK